MTLCWRKLSKNIVGNILRQDKETKLVNSRSYSSFKLRGKKNIHQVFWKQETKHNTSDLNNSKQNTATVASPAIEAVFLEQNAQHAFSSPVCSFYEHIRCSGDLLKKNMKQKKNFYSVNNRIFNGILSVEKFTKLEQIWRLFLVLVLTLMCTTGKCTAQRNGGSPNAEGE